MKSALEQMFTGFSADAEVGDVQDFGWFGLVRGPMKSALYSGDHADDAELWEQLDPDTRAQLETCAGVIVGEDSQGFIDVRIIDSANELDLEWAKIEAEAAEFYAEQDSLDR